MDIKYYMFLRGDEYNEINLVDGEYKFDTPIKFYEPSYGVSVQDLHVYEVEPIEPLSINENGIFPTEYSSKHVMVKYLGITQYLVQYLIDNGANDSQTLNKLLLAGINTCNYNYIKLAIDNGVCDTIGFNVNSGYHLMEAVRTRDLNIVKLLIDNGADITYESGNCENALAVAVNTRNIPMIDLLLDCGMELSYLFDSTKHGCGFLMRVPGLDENNKIVDYVYSLKKESENV